MYTAAGYELYDEELVSAMAGWGPFGGGLAEDVVGVGVDLALPPAATEHQPDYSPFASPPSPRWANQNRLNERAAAAAEGLAASSGLWSPSSAHGAVSTEHEPVGACDGAHATAARAPVYHSLYKTELCRSFEETGACRYGAKCQFAHGQGELRAVLRHPRYKTELCRTFTSSGSCPYGTRCRFIHYRGAAAATTVAPGGAKMTVTVPRFPGSNPPSPKSPKTPRNADDASSTPPESPRSVGTSTTDSPSPRSQSSLDGGSRSPGGGEQPPSPTESVKSHHRLPIFATLTEDVVAVAHAGGERIAPPPPPHGVGHNDGAAVSSPLPSAKQAHHFPGGGSPKGTLGGSCRKGSGRAAQRQGGHHQAGQHGGRVGCQPSSKQAAQ